MSAIELSAEVCACTVCGRYLRAGTARYTEVTPRTDGAWAQSVRHARNRRSRDDGSGDDDRSSGFSGPKKLELTKRHYHLACLAEKQPDALRAALASCELELEDRAELEELLRVALDRFEYQVDGAEERPATRARYREFMAKLAEAPDDDLLLVFGDWLATVEDPRGQLVAVQHALERATGHERMRLEESERTLLHAHRRVFVPEHRRATFAWRRGFIERATLAKDGSIRDLRHASLRLLRHLVVPAVVTDPPASVRILEVTTPLETLRELLVALPRLERVCIPLGAAMSHLDHPAVAELELIQGDPETFIPLTDWTKLPALRRLVLRGSRLDVVLQALANRPLPRLAELALHGDATAAMLEGLAAKVDLDVLDLRGATVVPADGLRALARTVLVAEAPPPPGPRGPWIVRHRKRPEWGHGRVIDEGDEGLRVEFDAAGEKLIRNVELLEDVD